MEGINGIIFLSFWGLFLGCFIIIGIIAANQDEDGENYP